MMKWRVNLAMLMGLVAVLALGLAAIKVASESLFQVLLCLSILTLLVGTLGAMVRRRREAWVGFIFFGWIYALVALIPAIQTAVLEKIPIDPQINRLIEWMLPPIEFPSAPEPSRGWKEGNNYVRIQEGTVSRFQPPPDEAKAIDEYMILLIPAHNREDAISNAPSIAYLFLGAAFAISGAALGHLLSDRAEPTNPSLAAPSSPAT